MEIETAVDSEEENETVPEGTGLKRSLKLLYVYALATGAILTFMCYWDGIFMSYCGPATFLGFAMMALLVLPIGFVYAEFSSMFPTAGSCLVFNTGGMGRRAGYWSAWLIMCAWLAVPAAGVLGIVDWIGFEFADGAAVDEATAFVIGAVLLVGITGVVLPIATSVLGFWYSAVRMLMWAGFLGCMGVGAVLWIATIALRRRHSKSIVQRPGQRCV